MTYLQTNCCRKVRRFEVCKYFKYNKIKEEYCCTYTGKCCYHHGETRVRKCVIAIINNKRNGENED